nr:hypothetical protein [Streptomyces sp. SID2563]
MVIEQSPDLVPRVHERRRPGFHHLAFHVEHRAALVELVVR